MNDPSSGGELSWTEIDALLDQALSLEGSERAAFLRGLDPVVRSQIEQVLTGEGEDFVDHLVEATLDGALEDLAGPRGMTDSVGVWRLERELGSGGMAQVFEAHRMDADFEQRAAVKILWPFRTGEQFHDRFVQERRILAGMSHPGIAGLLDGGVLPDGRPWFAMEYVEGENVVDHCSGTNLARRLDVFLQICDAVEYAHGRLIVHRDIKPANILVDGHGRVRLLDFGIAKIIDAADEQVTTRTGGSLLTLQYASPEQVTQAPLTVSTDVYQLGMLLYELIAGRLPYDLSGRSLKEAIDIICHQEPPPPSRYNAELGADLDAIVLFAVRKEPERRYPSVSALARDMRQYLEGRPVQARPQSRWYVFRRFLRRNRLLVGAAAVVFLALAAAAVVSLSMARRAATEAERSETAMSVLTSVFEQADPFDQPGPDITLGEALLARTDRIAEEVDHDPLLATRVFNRLALIFSQLGMYEQSAEAYGRSLEIAERAAVVPVTDRLGAVAGMATTLNSQGQFQETLAFLSRQSLDPPRDAEEAASHAYIRLAESSAHLSSGATGEASVLLSQAEALIGRFELSDPDLLLRFHTHAASHAKEIQDLEGAVHHARQALAHATAGGHVGASAVLLQNLGLHLARLGRYEEAEPYFLQAMAAVDEHAPGHPSKLEYATNYSGLLFRTGRLTEAVELLTGTIGALSGSPDRHLWTYANRDLATYALAAGDVRASVLANREQLRNAPELYGVDSPRTTVALVMFARHLSLAGFHQASIHVIQRALDTHPKIGNVSLAPFLAELRLDAGAAEAAAREYDPEAEPEDPNATLLGLKLACAAGDLPTLRSRVEAIDPEALGDSHLDQRLRAWRAVMEAGLAYRDGGDPRPGLDHAYEILAATPRLNVIERWRLLRELAPLYTAAGPLRDSIRTAWEAIEAQRLLARTLLLDDYLPAESPLAPHAQLRGSPNLQTVAPLACLH